MKPRDQQVTISELFEKNYIHGENGCWEWQGNFNNTKAPVLIYNKQIQDLRNWSYSTFTNPIPDGYFVYQECKNRKCVNPDHLKAVPYDEYVSAMASFEPLKSKKKIVVPSKDITPNTQEPSGDKYKIHGPDGGFYLVNDLEPFCKEHGLQVRFLQGIADGKYTQHKGYTCNYNK